MLFVCVITKSGVDVNGLAAEEGRAGRSAVTISIVGVSLAVCRDVSDNGDWM